MHLCHNRISVIFVKQNLSPRNLRSLQLLKMVRYSKSMYISDTQHKANTLIEQSIRFYFINSRNITIQFIVKVFCVLVFSVVSLTVNTAITSSMLTWEM